MKNANIAVLKALKTIFSPKRSLWRNWNIFNAKVDADNATIVVLKFNFCSRFLRSENIKINVNTAVLNPLKNVFFSPKNAASGTIKIISTLKLQVIAERSLYWHKLVAAEFCATRILNKCQNYCLWCIKNHFLPKMQPLAQLKYFQRKSCCW